MRDRGRLAIYSGIYMFFGGQEIQQEEREDHQQRSCYNYYCM